MRSWLLGYGIGGACVSIAAMIGCAPYRATDNPAPPVAVPERFVGESGPDQGHGRFWERFGSEGLTRTVEAALSGNFTLQGAWARLAQADASAAIAGAPRWPTLDAAAQGRVQRQVLPFTPASGDNSTVARAFTASLAASYEIDLWQRLGSAARAAALDRDAARDDVEAAAITLAAEVSERWFELAMVGANQVLLQRQLETNEALLSIVTARFEGGQTSGLDVSQQTQLVASTRSRLELLTAREATLRYQLAVLTGRPPGALSLDGAIDLVQLPPLPSVGIPSELLRRRPDLRAAQRRVAASDHRVAEAVADRYPVLRLTGEVSVLTQKSDFVSQALTPLWNLMAGLTAPIFDGNRRAAEVDRRDAVLAERVSDYGQAVLVSLLEVDMALVQERQQQRYLEQLALQLQAAQAAVGQSRERYAGGLTDFLPVLTAESGAQAMEQTMLEARRQLLSFRIQLYRALGGDWTSELTPAPPPAAEPTSTSSGPAS